MTTYALPLGSETIRRLIEVAKRLPVPEVANHLVVYDGDVVLLEAHDLIDGLVLANKHLGAETIEELRRQLTGEGR